MSVITTAHSVSSFGSTNPYTQAMKVSFNKRVLVSRIGIFGYANATIQGGGRIWDISGTLIGSSPTQSITISGNSTTPAWTTLSTPVYLEANTTYYIGAYMSAYTSYAQPAVTHNEPTVDGVTMTTKLGDTMGTVYSSGDSNPVVSYLSSGTTYEFPFSIDFTPDNAPTTSITYPASAQRIDPRLPLTVTWSYSDADNDPLTNTDIFWRASAGDAWNIIHQNTNSTSYTISANTFPDETNIEMYVAVYNANASGGSNHITFNSSSWQYGSEVASSSATGSFAFDAGTIQTGIYEVEVATADSFGFGPWSSPVNIELTDWTILNEVISSSNTGVVDATTLDAGDYEISVRVTDSLGDTGDWSTPITVTLVNTKNSVYINGAWRPGQKKLFWVDKYIQGEDTSF